MSILSLDSVDDVVEKARGKRQLLMGNFISWSSVYIRISQNDRLSFIVDVVASYAGTRALDLKRIEFRSIFFLSFFFFFFFIFRLSSSTTLRTNDDEQNGKMFVFPFNRWNLFRMGARMTSNEMNQQQLWPTFPEDDSIKQNPLLPAVPMYRRRRRYGTER